MQGPESFVLIVGGTARAAVMSARRAGWVVGAIDPFGDRDTRWLADFKLCAFEHFPKSLPDLATCFPAGPFLYTGGLENHHDVIERMRESRPLIGNEPRTLEKVRDPFWLQRQLASHGFPFPHTLPEGSPHPHGSRWLRKSRKSAGGLEVHDATAGETGGYLQEYLEGESYSAIFSSDASSTRLLGVTKQLIGQDWLHSGGYHYCGTIGPVECTTEQAQELRRLGNTLHREANLVGVWGVDLILHSGTMIPIEVNPRYTASLEVLELASGNSYVSREGRTSDYPRPRVLGKAIYFAPNRLSFPHCGPWDDDLNRSFEPWRVPGFADIPSPGEMIEIGRPVLTFFAAAATPEDCESRLRQGAAKLDALLENR